MNIWIVNHHALTPSMSGGTRHYDFARELTSLGHTITIIASSFHYAKHTEMKVYTKNKILQEDIEEIKFLWIKTPSYTGSGLKRIINMLSFTKTVINDVPKLSLSKPDIIIGSSVHLFAVYAAYKLSQHYKTPFVMEVRDLWPQTLIDLGISKYHPFILVLGWLELYLYKKADRIITLLPHADQYISAMGIKKEKIVWISNGVNTQNYTQDFKPKTDNSFLITYTGSLGKANIMDTFFEAAKKLHHTHPNTKFQVIGDGELKQKFQNYVYENKLSNVLIKESIPKSNIPQVLMQSDLLYVGLLDSPLYKYGISLNKIFDYLASGTPIVFASSAANNPIKEASAGITIHPENSDALVEAILKYNAMTKDERQKNSKAVLNYVEKNYSMTTLTKKLETLLKGLL